MFAVKDLTDDPELQANWTLWSLKIIQLGTLAAAAEQYEASRNKDLFHKFFKTYNKDNMHSCCFFKLCIITVIHDFAIIIMFFHDILLDVRNHLLVYICTCCTHSCFLSIYVGQPNMLYFSILCIFHLACILLNCSLYCIWTPLCQVQSSNAYTWYSHSPFYFIFNHAEVRRLLKLISAQT